MDLLVIGMLVGGLALLALGGELLVRGASRLAAIAGVSPLVIGLTVVSFGTSAPELAVSVQAGLAGNDTIALANVVGSNIFNILMILGLCAVILPLTVDQQLVRLDVPLMIGMSVLVYVLALDGRLDFWNGALLAAGIVTYTIWAVRTSRQESAAVQAEYAGEYAEQPGAPHTLAVIARESAILIVGLGVLVLGSRWLVNGAVALAAALGVSDVVIGLTIVAVGTSLPEVATSVVAVMRKERDIAIGNAIGSNLFNLLAILGVASMVTPGGLTVEPSLIRFDLPVMIAVAVACLPICFSDWLIDRREGWLFLGSYVAYTLYLVLSATQNPALPFYTGVMLQVVLPVLIIVLTLSWIQSLRRGQRSTPAKETDLASDSSA
jgi:cation:H+ antiporter